MPLTPKGTKIMGAMQREYGAKKGEKVFYASRNAGKIKGVEPAMAKPQGFKPTGVVSKRAANNNSKGRFGLKNTVTDNDPMASRSNGNYP